MLKNLKLMIKNYADVFTSFKYLDGYNEWVKKNYDNFASKTMAFILIMEAMFIPLDFIILKNSYWMTAIARMVFIALGSTLYFYCKKKKNFFSGSLSYFMILMNAAHFSFMYTGHRFPDRPDLFYNAFVSSCVVVFVCAVVVSRFRTDNKIYFSFLFASCLILTATLFNISMEFFNFFGLLFFLVNLNAFILKQTIVKVYREINFLSQVLPKSMAITVASSGEEVTEIKVFPPQHRPVVCLSADWRNFQKQVMNIDCETLASYFDCYYDKCFENLEIIDPKGEYFADWVGDELIVIFYSETNNIDEIKLKSLKFADYLATKLQYEIWEKCGLHVVFDIGISFGTKEENILGLLGQKRKKPTIVGPSAGFSKRYETEAKTIRKENYSLVETIISSKDELAKMQAFYLIKQPIVVFDQELYDFATQNYDLALCFRGNCKKRIGSSKNIEGKEVFVWQNRRISRQREVMSRGMSFKEIVMKNQENIKEVFPYLKSFIENDEDYREKFGDQDLITHDRVS